MSQLERVREYLKQQLESGAWDLTSANARLVQDGVVEVRLLFVSGSRRHQITRSLTPMMLEAQPLEQLLAESYRQLQQRARG